MKPTIAFPVGLVIRGTQSIPREDRAVAKRRRSLRAAQQAELAATAAARSASPHIFAASADSSLRPGAFLQAATIRQATAPLDGSAWLARWRAPSATSE